MGLGTRLHLACCCSTIYNLSGCLLTILTTNNKPHPERGDVSITTVHVAYYCACWRTFLAISKFNFVLHTLHYRPWYRPWYRIVLMVAQVCVCVFIMCVCVCIIYKCTIILFLVFLMEIECTCNCGTISGSRQWMHGSQMQVLLYVQYQHHGMASHSGCT